MLFYDIVVSYFHCNYKAQADTVLLLAKTLGCSYEDLIY